MFSRLTFLNRAVAPSTTSKLKILDPTILPTARSTSFFNAATIDVASSGTLVPIATTVKAIILSSTLK